MNYLFNFIKSLINLVNFIKLENKKKEFVFFSESKFYREHFKDLILELKKRDQSNIIFVTMDQDDIKYFKEYVKIFLISNFIILKLFFILLKCRFMIMTLPDLGNHIIKSKNCDFYVYFYHALGSTHKIYTKEAFKNYEIIFTNGEYQSKELRKAEIKYNFPRKEIVNVGYFFLDHLKKKVNLNIKEKNNILFAPSWNYNEKNLFNDYSLLIISKLLTNNFSVTFRPHPEHYKRSKKIIKKIINTYADEKNFTIDKNFSNIKSLEKANILITDNSSIVFEYLLIFKRPIIYINYVDKIHNKSSDQLNLSTIENELKKKFGNIILIDKLNDLPLICSNLVKRSNLNYDSIDEFTNEYISNLDHSSAYAAEYLIAKSKSLNKI